MRAEAVVDLDVVDHRLHARRPGRDLAGFLPVRRLQDGAVGFGDAVVDAGGDFVEVFVGGQPGLQLATRGGVVRSEEHTSELQSLMRISYAVFCLKKKKNKSSSQ